MTAGYQRIKGPDDDLPLQILRLHYRFAQDDMLAVYTPVNSAAAGLALLPWRCVSATIASWVRHPLASRVEVADIVRSRSQEH
jgi:hypothetical protein